jgi:hypothetical protein
VSLELNALFRKYASDLADLDQQQNQSQQKYNGNIKTGEDNRLGDLRKLSETFAGRGLAHSGISLGQQVKTNTGYDTARAAMDEQQKQDMITIDSNRASGLFQ